MSTEVLSVPDDPQLLKQLVVQQHEQLLDWQRKVEQLEHRLDLLLRRIYGPRSERLFDPNQGVLFDASGDATATPEASPPEPPAPENGPAQPKRRGHGRRRFPEKLERRRIPLDIPEKEKTCPCCGRQRKVIGEVVTERLGFEPTRFYVNQYVQLKYGCACEESGVLTAEKPIQPIEKGNAEPELAAFVAVSRFDDHSPYYRQEHGHFRRAGIHVARSTMGDWMRQIAELCQPLYDLMHTLVLRSKLLGTDDTPVPLLVPGRGKTQERTSGATAATTIIPTTCSTSR